MIKYFITDFDGTLVDTRQANIEAYKKAFERHGCKFDEDVYKNAFGLKFTEMCDIMNVRNDVEFRNSIRHTKSKLYPNYFDKVKLNHSLFGFMRRMVADDANVKLAIASTASRDNLYALLKYFSIASCFDVIVTGDDVKNGKPDPEVYNVVKSRLGVIDNSEVLVFEDSEVGIKSAEAAGINNIIRINTYN